MEIVLGFIIAVAIGITGVGAGVITAPVLILFMHVPPAHAVGTALAFSVAVKMLVVPMQIYRKQVDYRGLGLPAGGRDSGRARGIVYSGEAQYQGFARNSLRCSGIHRGDHGGRESLPLVAPSGSRRHAGIGRAGFRRSPCRSARKSVFRRLARAPSDRWRCCGSRRSRPRAWWERICSSACACR